MITLEECAQFAALETNELFTGAVLSTRHQSLLSTYRMNLERGPVAVRKMIVSDIRAAIDLGASKRAADLVLVLRLFLSKHLEARIAHDALEGFNAEQAFAQRLMPVHMRVQRSLRVV